MKREKERLWCFEVQLDNESTVKTSWTHRRSWWGTCSGSFFDELENVGELFLERADSKS